jgi:hypothetical protein
VKVSVRIEEARPTIWVEGRPWVHELGLSIFIQGEWHHDGEDLIGGAWEKQIRKNVPGYSREWRRIFTLDGDPLVSFALRENAQMVLVQVELLRDLTGVRAADSFEQPTFLAPTFSFPDNLKFFLTTFGLGPATEGGYWPEAKVGKGPGDLPKEAFAPLVLFSEEGALAIAPGNWFLTSSLVRLPSGAARGLCGAVDRLPAGFTVSTWFIAGDDVATALIKLGDLFMAQAGKTRPKPEDHPLLSTLGYWNAYGGYYSELFNPMNEETMEKLAAYIQRERIPIRYFGLDLWYRYQEIGQAIRYQPDLKKYPNGLAKICERTKLPYVLHLSALSRKNEYKSDGVNPAIYRTIAQELKEEGGIGVWYDWLRTHQHLVPALRADPLAAEQWFSGMAKAFQEQGLPVLLCMQTMGMVLASTAQPNVIAARSYIDYLFGQPRQIDKLAAMGLPDFVKDKKSRQEFIRNNVLIGLVLYALGLSPFHDLFITNKNHCEGFGDEFAEQEALLRSLSCGPVGIGDKLGEVDKGIVARLAFPDGRLAQPDRPLFPLQETLGEDILAAWTETRVSEKHRWIYLVVLNVSEEEKNYRVNVSQIFGDEYFIYDYFNRQVVEKVVGSLPPAWAHYYVLVPKVAGFGFLGLSDKFITVPRGMIQDLEMEEKKIRATVCLPQGEVYPLGVSPFAVGLTVKTDGGAELLKVERGSDLVIAWVKPTQKKFSICFGLGTGEEREIQVRS